MAIRNIRKLGDDILRKKCRPVEVIDERIITLLDDMVETMKNADGAGLAAPQVGVLKRVVVIDVEGKLYELINPEIIKTSGVDLEQEGCLSCGKQREYVQRPMTVTVKAQDRYGFDFTLTGEKWLARCICHEVDHLDGILFLDKAVKK